MKKLKRNGFTLIEALLALFITSLVSLLGCMLMRCALHFAHMDVDTQNQFAVLQLRRELAQSNDLKIESDCLSYILNHEKKVLYFDKHRIVKSPGYEIYMEQIDEAIFYKKEDGYYVWFKRRIKPMTLNSINGYASEVSLVCLFLVLQIVSFLSLSTLQNVYLLKANQQNILELSIVDHAKHMIHHNNRIKLCHTSEKIIKDKDERIQNIDVHFEDHETFIECTYLDVSMKIYYDDKAIVSVDIDEQ